MLECYERAEREAEYFIDNHDKDIELVMIRPEIPLKSQVFGSRSEDLVTDYKVGWYDGAQAIAGLGHWQVAGKADEQGAVEPAEDTALLS